MARYILALVLVSIFFSCNKTDEKYTLTPCEFDQSTKTGEIKKTYGIVLLKQASFGNEATGLEGKSEYFIQLFDKQDDLGNEDNLLPTNYLACNLPDDFKRNFLHVTIEGETFEPSSIEQHQNIVPISLSYIVYGPGCSE